MRLCWDKPKGDKTDKITSGIYHLEPHLGAIAALSLEGIP